MLSSLKFNFGANDSQCQSGVQLFGLVCVHAGVGGVGIEIEVRVKDKLRFLWKDVHLLTSKLFPHFKLKRCNCGSVHKLVA